MVHPPYRSLRTAVLLMLALRMSVAAAQGDTLMQGLAFPNLGSLKGLPMEADYDLDGDTTLPRKVDLSIWLPPAGNQGKQASCVGWALGYGLMGYYENVRLGRRMGPGVTLDTADAFSPAFLYDMTMHREKEADCSQGISELNDAIDIACDTGCVKWSMYPYDAKTCLRPVPPHALSEASAARMSSPVRLGAHDKANWRSQLAEGHPIVVGISVDSTFKQGSEYRGDSMFVWKRGFVKDGLEWDTFKGHFMVCAGYDDATGTYLVLNSWGTQWGWKGYCRVPYTTLHYFCFGAFVLQDGPAPPASKQPWIHMPWRTHDDDEVIEKLSTGDHHKIDGVGVELVRAAKDRNAANVAVRDKSGKLLHTLHLRKGRPVKLFVDDQLCTFTYTGPHPKDRPDKPRITMRLQADDTVMDPMLEELFRKVDMMEDGIPGNMPRE